jgi:hypothetical protein
MGLAVRAGAPKPDISTPEKFIAALKSGEGGDALESRVAHDGGDDHRRLCQAPEFAGNRAPASTKGEGGQALASGKGTWRFRRSARFFRTRRSSSSVPCRRNTVCGSTRWWRSRRAPTHPDDAKALIPVLLRPESNKVWKPRGMERFE